jgi:hypothetical protein
MVFLIFLLFLALLLTGICGSDYIRDNIYVQLVFVIIIIIYLVLAGIYDWKIPVRY